jgi:hypothetical protein
MEGISFLCASDGGRGACHIRNNPTIVPEEDPEDPLGGSIFNENPDREENDVPTTHAPDSKRDKKKDDLFARVEQHDSTIDTVTNAIAYKYLQLVLKFNLCSRLKIVLHATNNIPLIFVYEVGKLARVRWFIAQKIEDTDSQH